MTHRIISDKQLEELLNKYAAHQSVEFVKWIEERYYRKEENQWAFYMDSSCTLVTTEQLYEIYLKEKGV